MNSYIDNLRVISCLILDIDGVMTDGRIGYAANREEEVKFFDVKDGHAIKLLQRAGLKVGGLSGRASQANRLRAKELSFNFLKEGEKDKLAAFEKILKEQQLGSDQCLYIGDDMVDIPVMRRCRLAVAVADAVPEVRAIADYVTEARGGFGAIREVAVKLLEVQGLWEKVVQKYYR